ncbi:MAG: leukotoxin LktA family filamentous adhesin [Akkermansia sp.]
MKLHLPHALYRSLLRTFAALLPLSVSAASAAMISPDGRTDTTVLQQGNVYNVYTGTVRGNTGFNSFSTFDVYSGTTANLHLASGTANLVNVVRDKCSFIDGVLNSYKDGSIGGNVFFLNPHGIVVGSSGIVNTGSISMSTPTAAFIEQLIARDGAISEAATKAVLAGDMPINDKGLIAVKGQVNARGRATVRAGKVEVSGSIRTRVPLREMVNTGGAALSDGQGMRLEGGKLRFGSSKPAAKPARLAKRAKQPRSEQPEREADLRFFARDITLDGAQLDAASVYIDPDTARLSNTTISGNYTLEGRVVTLENVTMNDTAGSLTLRAANELGDGLYAGDVSLSISGSDLTAGSVSISADATVGSASATITISDSSIRATLAESAVTDGSERTEVRATVQASSSGGSADIRVTNSRLSADGQLDISARGQQSATVALNNGSVVRSNHIALLAEAQAGDAALTLEGGSRAEGNPLVIRNSETDPTDTEDVNELIALTARSTERDAAVRLGAGSEVAGLSGGIALEAAAGRHAELSVASKLECIGSITLSAEGGSAATPAEGSGAALTLGSGSLLNSQDSVVLTLQAAQGTTLLSQQAGSSISAATVTATLHSADGAAEATLGGSISAGSNISISATTGISEQNAEGSSTVSSGSGDARISISGSLQAGEELALTATALHEGDATLQLSDTAVLQAKGSATHAIGSPSITRREGESDEAYTKRYMEALRALPQQTLDLGALLLNATAAQGSARMSTAAGSRLSGVEGISLRADGGRQADIQLQGSLTGGEIAATATAREASLRTAAGSVLESSAYQYFNGVESEGGEPAWEVSSSPGNIYLSAERKQPDPGDNSGSTGSAVISLNGSLRRRDDLYRGDETGCISICSDGSLSLEQAELDNGAHGRIILDAAEQLSAGADSRLAGDISLVQHTAQQQSFNPTLLPGSTTRQEFGELNITSDLLLSEDTVWVVSGAVSIADGVTIDAGAQHNLTIIVDSAKPFGYSTLSIGDNVTITNAGNISITQNKSLTGLWRLATRNICLGGGSYISVGDHFSATLSGDFSMSAIGCGGTGIDFGANAAITAKSITLSATTLYGYGLSTNTKFATKELGTIIKDYSANSPLGQTIGKAVSSIPGLTIDTPTFLRRLILGEGAYKTTGLAFYPLMAISKSSAHIRFADSSAAAPSTLTATGGNITLKADASAKTNASYSKATGFILGFGLGLTDSDITLGKQVHLTATQDISLRSDLSSSVALKSIISKTKYTAAGMVNVSVNLADNSITLADTATLNAEGGSIDIQAESSVSNSIIGILGGGKEYEYQDQPGGARVLKDGGAGSCTKYELALGIAVTEPTTTITLDGDLHAAEDISVGATLDTSSYSSGFTDLNHTLTLKEEEEPGTYQKLLDTLKEWGIAFKPLSLFNDIKDFQFPFGDSFKKELSGFTNQFNNAEQEVSTLTLSAALAVNVALSECQALLNGSATTDNGGLELSSSLSATNQVATAAFIRGAASKAAISTALCIPYFVNTSRAEIGSDATAHIRGGELKVSSSLELPPLYDWAGIPGLIIKAVNGDDGKPLSWDGWIKGINDIIENLQLYGEAGDLGLSEFTTSWAQTGNRKTGIGDKQGGGSSTGIGGDLTVAYYENNAVAQIADGATISQSGSDKGVNVTTELYGYQLTFGGYEPLTLTLGGADIFASQKDADNGMGFSIICENLNNSAIARIGRLSADDSGNTLSADALNICADSTLLSLAANAAGAVSNGKNTVQGAVSYKGADVLTLAQLEAGNSVTLRGGSNASSSVRSTDNNLLLNVSGELATGTNAAVGIGLAISDIDSFTGAFIGGFERSELSGGIGKNWEALGFSMTDSRAESELTMNGGKSLSVEAETDGLLISIGVAASGLTSPTADGLANGALGQAGAAGNNATDSALAAAASNIAITNADFCTRADISDTTLRLNDAALTLRADSSPLIVTVGGNLAFSSSGASSAATIGASVGVNLLEADAYATLNNSSVSSTGNLSLRAEDDSEIVCVAVAGAVGGSSFVGSAGVAWNSIGGDTKAGVNNRGDRALMGRDISVIAESSPLIFATTLGVSVSATGLGDIISYAKDFTYMPFGGGKDNRELAPQADAAEADAGLQLLAEGGTRLAVGASFTRSTVKRSTEASIIGAPVTATGSLRVSADTTGCITNVGLGAGIILTGEGNASAGAVISILPVTTHTIAAIEQAAGVNEPLSVRAESLSLHATEDWRVRNWAMGAGLSKGVGIGAAISWADYSGSDVSARIRNSTVTTTGTLPGSADDQANVDIFADSSRQMFMVTAGASAGSTVAVSASVNYMNFAGTVDAGLTGSTLTTPGDLRLGTHVYRGLSGLMGSLSFNLDAEGLASVGAAFAYATFDDTATALVSSSRINAARGATLAADGKTELGYYGGSVGLSSGKVGFDGTVAVLKNKAVNQAQALNSSFTLSSGSLTLHAASTGIFNTAFLSPSIGIGDTALNVGLTVAYLDDTATSTALLKNSEAQARDITLQATGECTLEGLAAGLATAGRAAVTGQALATTIAHNITAQAVNSSLTTTAGQLKVLADNSVTIGRARQGYVAGGISAAFNGVGIGASVSFIDIVDKVRANLDNCSATVAGKLLVQATEDAYLRSYSATLAGGFYGGGAVNVNRAVLRSYTQADISADSAKTITTGGDLSLRSENKQSLELNTWGMAGGVYGAAAVGVSYANMAGGSNAAVTGALTLNVGGNLLLDALTTRTASYLAINAAVAAYGAVNVAVCNLYLGDATEAYSKNADDQQQVSSAKSGALSALDDVLAEAYGSVQSCGVNVDGFVSLQAAEAAMAPERPQTEARLDCLSAQVSGSSSIRATDTLNSTPKNVNVTVAIVPIGVHVNNTTIDSVTLATVADDTQLHSRGDILISAEHRATDSYSAVPVTGGAFGVRVCTYGWEEKSLTRTAIGSGVTLSSEQGCLSLRSDASATETFTHTGVNASGGDISVLLPSFDHTGTSELSLGNDNFLTASGDVRLESGNSATLRTAVYDIVFSGTIGIDISAQHSLIDPTESLTLGNNNILASYTGNLSLLRRATHTLDFTLRHYGFSTLDLLFPTIELTDNVDGSLSLGSGNRLSAAKDMLLESSETLDRELNLHGGTGSAISVQNLRNQSKATGSNQLTLGSNNSLHAGDGLRLRARSTDGSTAQTTNIKISGAGLAQVATLENISELDTALSIDQGVDLQASEIALESDAVTELTNSACSVNVGIALDAYSATRSLIRDNSGAVLSIAGGRIAADSLRAAATTTATLLQYATIGGGSLIYTNPRCTLEAISTQTATLTLGTGSNALNIYADSSDLYAANTYRHPYETGRNDNIHGGGVGIGGSTAAGSVIVKPTAHATVTLSQNSSLQRRHRDAAHYILRDKEHTAISAVNDIETHAGIDLFGGGVLFSVTEADPTLVTRADATLNILGSVDSWNKLILTAYSHTYQESLISATSYALIPVTDIDRRANITAEDSIAVSGDLNCIGSITFNAGSAERSLTLPTGKLIATVGLSDLNNNRSVAIDDDEQNNNRSAVLDIRSTVRAGGDIAVYNDAARFLSGQELGGPVITSVYSLSGTLNAGLAARQEWSFREQDGRPELNLRAGMELFDGMSLGSDGLYHADGETTRALYSYGSDSITLIPLILNGSSIELNISGSSIDSTRYSNPQAQTLSISSSSPRDLSLQGIVYSNRGSDLVLNGRVQRRGDEERLNIITTNGNSDLTLQGLYNIPRARFCISAAGDILNRGSVLAGSVDFATSGNYDARSDGNYSLSNPLSQYGDIFASLENKTSSGTTRVTTTNSPASVPVLTASGSITITAQGYLDLNCRMTSGLSSVSIPESITLSDSSGRILSVEAALARYEADPTQSQFLINELRNTGINSYFDAPTRSIVLESPCERDTGIYLTGKLLNTDTSGTACLSVLNGYRDLVIDNQSVYTLRLGNMALSHASQGEIVLTDLSNTPRSYRYTVDPTTGKTLCTTTFYAAAGPVTTTTESSDFTPQSTHYLTISRERTTSYKRTWLSWNKQGSNPSYDETRQMGSEQWGTIRTEYQEVFGTGNYFVVSSEMRNYSHTYYDPGWLRRYRHTATWDTVRTDTLYISAANKLAINFFGADGSALTVNTHRSDICVGGTVSADRIALNSALSITSRGDNLLRARQISLSATGNIGSMADFVHIQLVDSSPAGGGLSLSSGGSAYIAAEGDLPLDSVHTQGSAYLFADSDISGSASCGDLLLLYSDQGGITLSTATDRLSARAADDISIDNRSRTGELLLGSLLSENGNISLRSNGSIAADVNADLTDILSDQTLAHSLSLHQATNEIADSLSEHYHSELTRYTTLYFEQDSEGNYTHRDARGYLLVSDEEAETKAALSGRFTELYNEGKGESLVEYIQALSGTDYVGGTIFESTEDVGSYICDHTDEAAQAFANSQYDRLIRDLTQDIIANAQQQGTDVVDYGAFTETQYRQYWERNADGSLRYQDAQGNFISPSDITADGSSTPLYDAETCAAITEQFRGSTPALWYLLNSEGNNTLNSLAKVVSGSNRAEQLFRQAADDLSIVAMGKAIPGTNSTIIARQGSVHLYSTNGNIGNESLRISLSPADWNSDGSPIYSTWQQEFMQGVREGSISGAALERRESDGTCIYSISTRSFTRENISELDFHLLAQASESDVSRSGELFTIRTHGYLGIEAQSIACDAAGAVYISSPGDINLSPSGVYAERDIRLSSGGSISGSSMSCSSGYNLVLYAEGDIGSETSPLSMGGNGILNLTAEGNAYLHSATTLNLCYMDAEDIFLTLTGGASLTGTADHNGRADNPHITCRHLTLNGSGYSLSSVGSGAEGALVINTHGLDGGALLESNTPNDTLPLVRLFPTNTVYPFTLRTGSHVAYIDQMTLPYFGNIVLGNPLHVGSITFLQSNANAHSNSISTSAITIDRELNLLGEADFTTSFNDGIRFSGDGRINIDNPGSGTAFFESIETGDNHQLSIRGRGNININELHCGQLKTALDGHLEVLLAEVADSARLSVGSNLILGFIDVRHFRADVGGSLLVLWGETESFSATANGNIRALLTTADGAGVLPVGDVIATHGSVDLMGDADVLNITGTIQGYHVALTSSGDIRRATGGNIRASRSYTPTRYADVYERQFSGGLIEFIDTLGINMSLDDSAGIAADTLDKLREAAEREISDHAEDTAPELRFINRDGSRAADAEQWNGATTDITTTLTALSR